MNVKIAITSDDGKQVAAHFGRTKGFVICELEDKKIKNKNIAQILLPLMLGD